MRFDGAKYIGAGGKRAAAERMSIVCDELRGGRPWNAPRREHTGKGSGTIRDHREDRPQIVGSTTPTEGGLRGLPAMVANCVRVKLQVFRHAIQTREQGVFITKGTWRGEGVCRPRGESSSSSAWESRDVTRVRRSTVYATAWDASASGHPQCVRVLVQVIQARVDCGGGARRWSHRSDCVWQHHGASIERCRWPWTSYSFLARVL